MVVTRAGCCSVNSERLRNQTGNVLMVCGCSQTCREHFRNPAFRARNRRPRMKGSIKSTPTLPVAPTALAPSRFQLHVCRVRVPEAVSDSKNNQRGKEGCPLQPAGGVPADALQRTSAQIHTDKFSLTSVTAEEPWSSSICSCFSSQKRARNIRNASGNPKAEFKPLHWC